MEKQIKQYKIKFTKHALKAQCKTGRPDIYEVKNYLKSKQIYKITKAKKNRIKLHFYKSRKYDLIVIVEQKGKTLKIITYYNYMKKKRMI